MLITFVPHTQPNLNACSLCETVFQFAIDRLDIEQDIYSSYKHLRDYCNNLEHKNDHFLADACSFTLNSIFNQTKGVIHESVKNFPSTACTAMTACTGNQSKTESKFKPCDLCKVVVGMPVKIAVDQTIHLSEVCENVPSFLQGVCKAVLDDGVHRLDDFLDDVPDIACQQAKLCGKAEEQREMEQREKLCVQYNICH
eukprot:Pgem_evm1s6390